MNSYTDDGRTYVSTEPCHYGMVKMPPASISVLNWLEGLRAYQKRFEPYPWIEAIVSEEA